MGISMGTAALAVGVVGAVTSAVGAASQGEAAGAEASYRAQVAANNKIIADQNAEQAVAAGESKAASQGLASAAQIGAIKAAQGASGVDVNTGSNVDVVKSQDIVNQEDAENIRYNAASEAYGYKVQAAADTGEQGLETALAGYAPIAGDIGAAGTLLGGASSVGSRYAAWLNMGGNPNAANVAAQVT